MVPEGGIEPPTRGFSIHCSTPELPGHYAVNGSGWGVLGLRGAVSRGFLHSISMRLRHLLFNVLKCLPRHSGSAMEWHSPFTQHCARSTSAQRRSRTGDNRSSVAFRRSGSSSQAPQTAAGARVCVAVRSAQRGPTNQMHVVDLIAAEGSAQGASKARRSFLGIGAKIEGDLAAKAAHTQRLGQGAHQACWPCTSGQRGVVASVHIHSDQRACGFIYMPPMRHQPRRTSAALQCIQNAVVSKPPASVTTSAGSVQSRHASTCGPSPSTNIAISSLSSLITLSAAAPLLQHRLRCLLGMPLHNMSG